MDVEALRSKYARLAAARDLKGALAAAQGGGGDADPHPAALDHEAAADTGAARRDAEYGPAPSGVPGARIAHMRICDVCNGAGVVKQLYNYIVTGKTCRRCEGDGVVAPTALASPSRGEDGGGGQEEGQASSTLAVPPPSAGDAASLTVQPGEEGGVPPLEEG